MTYALQMTAATQALAIARALPVRADMQRDFEAEGAALPIGPIWTLLDGDRVVGLGGLERRGAGTSAGWLLVPEGLSARDWAKGRRAILEVLQWAAWHSVRRVAAVVEAGNIGAQHLLARLGFEASDRDGDDITMVRELV